MSAATEYWFDSHDGLRLYSRVYPRPARTPRWCCVCTV